LSFFIYPFSVSLVSMVAPDNADSPLEIKHGCID